MKRLVLSLVTALSLMGAAQAFALPVPTVERLNFRDYATGVDSTVTSFGGVYSGLKYSVPIPTRLLVDPLRLAPTVASTASGASGPDTNTVAVVRILPKSGSTITVSGDSIYLAIQVSNNGADWVTWSPTAGHPFRVTASLGSNASWGVLESGTTNAFWAPILQKAQLGGYPAAPSQIGVITPTDLAGLMSFRLFRIVLEARDLAGQYVLDLRHFREENKVVKEVETDVPFRFSSSSFANGYADSGSVSSVGSSTIVVRTDTTAWVGTEKWMPPHSVNLAGPSAGAVAVDTLNYASVFLLGLKDGAVTSSIDTIFVTPQLNIGEGVIVSLPQLRVFASGTGSNSFNIPLKMAMIAAAGGSPPCGWMSPPLSGYSLLINRIYGVATSMRFIVVKDGVHSAKIQVKIRHYEAVEN